MAIKAIETEYKGYRFRSRLEARWAVFFDTLGLKWEYESQGFDLGELGWYLPDFLVEPEWADEDDEDDEDWSWFIEIKPHPLNDKEKAKVEALPFCIPLIGTPEIPEMEWTGDWDYKTFRKYVKTTQLGFFLLTMLSGFDRDRVKKAVKAARQSRFEFGQFGPPSEWDKAN